MCASARLLRVPGTPLLEVKCDAGSHALVAESADPVWMRRPSTAAAFAARDDPVESAEVLGKVEGSQERLTTQESILTGNVQQKTDALVREDLVFDGRSEPDVDRPRSGPRR